MVQKHVSDIARLKEETQAIVGSIDGLPYNNDVYYLRYCLEDTSVHQLKKNLAWKQGPGKAICEAALSAFEKATKGEKWNNEPVRQAALCGDKINKYITPTNLLTTASSEEGLLYCIKAGLIDDAALMATLVSAENMVDFFLYCKEVNALVANDRSLEMDKMLYVLTVNDLKGLNLIAGDATFRRALSMASEKAANLYPGIGGPTLLLNLPRLVCALVKSCTPLFPLEVQARIKFERGPLENFDSLIDVSHDGKDRDSFLQEVDKKMIY